MIDIVFCGVNDWRNIKQRPQHLAERLSEAHRVVYVNPIAYSVPTHILRCLHHTTSRRWRPHLEQLAVQLWLFTPGPALPFSRRLRLLNRLNQVWLAFQLRPVLHKLGMPSPLLWLSFPTDVDLIGRLYERHIIFDCMDNYPGFFKGREHTLIAAMEADLLRRADLVLATAQPLLEKCRRFNNNVHLVPNGVDVAHFARVRAGLTEADDLRAYPHPRFGYVGTIGPWTDVESMMALAQTAPDSSVLIIGPWEVPQPANLPANFHILGPRPYAHLPEYLAGFDVALIPFRVNALTQAVNPVKLFEYAVAGVPIVATATEELTRYAEWCTLVDSQETFVAQAIRIAQNKNQPETLARCATAVMTARANAWEHRIQQIQSLLNALGENKAADE